MVKNVGGTVSSTLQDLSTLPPSLQLDGRINSNTEAFPDLGAHCDDPDCNQLDFLPFACDGCGKVFCTDHRTYCALERTAATPPGPEGDRAILDAHAWSRRCDPARKRRPRCPARRCKEALTFSNATECKGCGQKVCLKHRFPAEHDCAAAARATRAGQCGRDVQKKDGGALALPPSIRNLKIF